MYDPKVKVFGGLFDSSQAVVTEAVRNPKHLASLMGVPNPPDGGGDEVGLC
jgi:hypothetical protein